MSEKTIINHLPVKLTADERAQKAHRLAQAVQEADDLEAELGEVKRTFKNRDEALQMEIRLLGRLVRDGVEDRPIECEERANWSAVTMETYRLDTGALVNFRPMTREERQRELDYPNGGH